MTRNVYICVCVCARTLYKIITVCSAEDWFHLKEYTDIFFLKNIIGKK